MPTPKGVLKPIKWTEATRKTLIGGARRGYPTGVCLALAKVSDSTWWRWKRMAKRGSEEHAAFFREFEQARAANAAELMNVVAQAAKTGDVKAAMYMLKVLHHIGDSSPSTFQVNIDNRGRDELPERDARALEERPTEDLNVLYGRLLTGDVIEAEEA